jgi:uncharacterized membrane protein
MMKKLLVYGLYGAIIIPFVFVIALILFFFIIPFFSGGKKKKKEKQP